MRNTCSWLLPALVGSVCLQGATIQYIEAVGGVGGLPANATVWFGMAFVDPTTHPSNPATVVISALPAGLVLLNTPTLFWTGDTITSIQPANFTVNGVYYASESTDTGFAPCVPGACITTSTMHVSFIDPANAHTLTADTSFIGSVPEPASLGLVALGALALVLKARYQFVRSMNVAGS